MKKKFFKALILLPIRHRTLVRLLLILLIPAAILAICFGRYHHDLARMLPDHSESARTYERIVKSAMFNKVLLIFHTDTDNVLHSQLPQYLEKLAPRLEQTSGALAIKANYRLFGDDLQTAHFAELTAFLPQVLPVPELSVASARKSAAELYRELLKPSAIGQAEFLRNDPARWSRPLLAHLAQFQQLSGIRLLPGTSYMISENGRYMLLLLETSASIGNPGQARQLQAFLDANLQDLPPGTHCIRVVPHQRALANERIIKQDIQRISLLSLIVLPLLFWFIYRRDLCSFLIPLLPIPAALIVLGVMSTVIFREGILLAVVGMGGVVLSLAVDYGIHIYTASSGSLRFRKLIRLAPALLAGMFTSVTVFALFLFSPMNGFRQLGVFAGGSLLLSLLVMLWIMPALLPAGTANESTGWFPAQIRPLRHPRRIYWGGFAFLLLCALALPFLRFNSDLRYFDVTPPAELAAEALYHREFQPGSAPGCLVFAAPDTEQALRQTGAALDTLRSQTNGRYFSPTDLYPDAAERNKNLHAWQTALRDGRLAAWEKELRNAAAQYGFQPAFFDPFFEHLTQGIREPVAHPPKLFAPILKRLITERADTSIAVITPDTPELGALARATGGVAVSQQSFGTLIASDISRGVGALAIAAVASVLLLTTLFFRSWRLALLALLPLPCSLLPIAAFFVWTGREINIAVLIAGMILCGLAVDYGIFLVHARGLTPRVFRALTLSALTSVAGGLTVIFAAHPLLRDTGISLIIGIAGSWLCAVLLLPALLQKPPQPSVSRKIRLIIFGLGLLLLCGCRTEVFPKITYAPVPPEGLPTSHVPQQYLQENSIEIQFFNQGALFLGLLRINEQSGIITLGGLTPGGTLLFTLQGKNDVLKNFWFMPGLPWATREKELAEWLLRAVTRIYLPSPPPKNARKSYRDGQMFLRFELEESAFMEYVYAGNPPVLIRQTQSGYLWNDWQIRYFRRRSDGRAGDLIYDDFRHHIRLIIRNKAGSQVPNECRK